MGMHNEYLKHKNWKNISYGSSAYVNALDGFYENDILPQKQSMRDSAKFGNCAWKPWVEHKYHPSKWNQIASRLSNFLKGHIGKSYDKTYSEFREKFPHQYGKIDVVKNFKDRFLDIATWAKLKERRWTNNPFTLDWSYYVDEQGIIRNMYLDVEKAKPKEKNLVEVNVRSAEWMYRFNPVVFEDGAVYAMVLNALPRKFHKYVEPDITFSESIYHEITRFLTFGTFVRDITNVRSERFWNDNGYDIRDVYDYEWDKTNKQYIKTYRCTQLNFSSVEYFLFTKRLVKDCDYMEVGTPEHKKYVSETKQKKEKELKEREKEFNERMSHALSDITYERKHKDDVKNIIDRDRLGFDENSFKGDFYHGQKRKKK